MDENRRNFLKTLGCTAVGAGCGLPILRALASTSESGGRQLGMVVDVQKCMNPDLVRACSDACRQAHNLPVHSEPERQIRWIWTETYESAFPDQAHAHSAGALKGKPMLLMCNHCSNPACVKVCPTKATWKRKSDGVVMMDMHRCIGCRYCIAACPYGSRSFNWSDPRPNIQGGVNPNYPTRSRGVVEKCSFCAERLRAGREPACVEASQDVPGGKDALTFGDLSDPNSAASKLLRENHTICRQLGLGTGPNVYYIV